MTKSTRILLSLVLIKHRLLFTLSLLLLIVHMYTYVCDLIIKFMFSFRRLNSVFVHVGDATESIGGDGLSSADESSTSSAFVSINRFY